MSAAARRAALASAVLSLVLRAAVVRAQADVEGAATAYERGVAALHADRYGDAAIEFEASYRLNPSPRVLYNLALAYRGVGRYVSAAETFDRYLREQPAIPSDRREAVDREVQRLRTRLGLIRCRLRPADASLQIDGRARACSEAVFVDPGDRVLEVRAEGYRSSQHRVRVDPGAEIDFRVDLVANAAPSDRGPRAAQADPRLAGAPAADRDARAAPFYARWWFWTIVGAAVAGGVVTGVLLSNSHPSAPSVGQDITVEAITAP